MTESEIPAISSARGEKKRTKNFPIYPILVGIYPVLALTAFNIIQIDLSTAYRSFILSIVFALALFSILALIMRSWSRAALQSLFLLVLFFSYGHIYQLLKNVSIFGFLLGRHRLLMIVWAGLAGMAVWISTRKAINLVSVTRTLNIISVILLVFPIFQIVQNEIKHSFHGPLIKNASASTSQGSHSPYPDIYYIILDGYGRANTLQAVYSYDNSAFLNSLTQRGFYVANCSQANYGYTDLSLGSSLNLDYLDKLTPELSKVMDLIPNNAFRQYLKMNGYTIVAFETGFRWTQWEDADVYIKYQGKSTDINNFGALILGTNSFEALFLGTTLLRIPIDYGTQAELAKNPLVLSSTHHDQIVYNLNSLKNIPGSIQSPKFVFAHLIIPHPPYVFSPTGELVPDTEVLSGQIIGYRNAVIYANSQILAAVDKIIADSKTPPVIVIQGDHGPWIYDTPLQHMAILNAYYLPGHMDSLYPSISPVNTFRVVLNSYFGQHYPLLDDISWYSTSDDWYNLKKIPNECEK